MLYVLFSFRVGELIPFLVFVCFILFSWVAG